jgi:hypothetical protein
MPKKVEECIFLEITDVEHFRLALHGIVPLITSTAQVQADLESIHASKQKAISEARSSAPLIPLVGTNISFSHWGLIKVLHTSLSRCNGLLMYSAIVRYSR